MRAVRTQDFTLTKIEVPYRLLPTQDATVAHFKDDILPQHASLASHFSIGTSHEGRELFVVRVTSGEHSMSRGVAVPNGRPALWMMALIHAREWLTGATLDWIIEQVLERCRKVYSY